VVPIGIRKLLLPYIIAGPGNVTNSSACTDGYVHGWEHWCEKNTKDCAQLAANDILPGSLVTDNKTALAGLKTLSDIVGTWNSNINQFIV